MGNVVWQLMCIIYAISASFMQGVFCIPSHCDINMVLIIIPILTLVKAKNGYRPSNYAVCSHFLFGNDLCYFFTVPVLVFFMMLRMADFEINS